MAEVPRPDRTSSCEKSYRVDKVHRERCCHDARASVCYAGRRLNVFVFARKNNVWNRDGGMVIQIDKRAQLR